MTGRIAFLLTIAALALLLGAGRGQADFNPYNTYYDNSARAATDNDANKVRLLVTVAVPPPATT